MAGKQQLLCDQRKRPKKNIEISATQCCNHWNKRQQLPTTTYLNSHYRRKIQSERIFWNSWECSQVETVEHRLKRCCSSKANTDKFGIESCFLSSHLGTYPHTKYLVECTENSCILHVVGRGLPLPALGFKIQTQGEEELTSSRGYHIVVVQYDLSKLSEATAAGSRFTQLLLLHHMAEEG